ncbi:hypothetical protein MMC28_003776 [Mycoblastus sanguinarius]|nr:hypothetical protein [Mycoblastus sanguinarius]
MSQGPSTSRPSSSSPHEERHKRLPPLNSRTLPPIQSTNRHGVLQDVVPNAPATQNVSARLQPQSCTPPDQRSSRPIGVQNLLNPTTNGDSSSNQNRRRNAEHLDPPSRATPVKAMPRSATPSLPPTSMINRSPVEVSLPSFTPPMTSVYPQPLGRALTPRSPSTYGHGPITMNTPSATMDAKQSPFVLPRDYTVTGGLGTRSMPDVASTSSMPGEPFLSSLPSSRSPPLRRGSQESSRHSRMQILLERTGGVGTGSGPHAPASQSDSPSTQYSSYSQVSQTPPAAAQPTVSTGQPTSFFSSQFTASGPASTMPQMGFDTKNFDVPPSSNATGGSTYQMMTLETDQGPIQVPVDVQAASKVADEKRKRNATASHRFRQRRKEKERETSQNIAKLEQQIREMEEDKEHYRRERDYFREVAVRSPGQAHIMPRPTSPRQRRHASLDVLSMQYPGSEGGSRIGGRNTRRRTSAYIPPSGPIPQSSDLPQNLPHYDSVTSNPAMHTQGGNRARLQDSFSMKTGPFDPSATR